MPVISLACVRLLRAHFCSDPCATRPGWGERAGDDRECCREVAGWDVAEADNDAFVIGWCVPTVVVGTEPDTFRRYRCGDLLFGVSVQKSDGDMEAGVACCCWLKVAESVLFGDEAGDEVMAFAVHAAGLAKMAIEFAVHDEAVHCSLEMIWWLYIAHRSQSHGGLGNPGRV
jgi:hypothetical protein